jgi:hypothetical protein
MSAGDLFGLVVSFALAFACFAAALGLLTLLGSV